MDVCLLWMLYIIQVEVPETGWSLAQGRPKECVLLSVIRRNNNPLHLQWVDRSGKTKKEGTWKDVEGRWDILHEPNITNSINTITTVRDVVVYSQTNINRSLRSNKASPAAPNYLISITMPLLISDAGRQRLRRNRTASWHASYESIARFICFLHKPSRYGII